MDITAGTALVVVTHDLRLAHSCHRVLELEAGRIIRDYNGEVEVPVSA